ncbi:hypothetical protein FHY21_002240 [Xanthomonas arboricola]
MQTDHLHWSLPAHRRGTLGGMDAATELTWTYLQRVPRWWAGKDPAAKAQMIRSLPDLSIASNQVETHEMFVSQALGNLQAWSRARCPHRSRDTPSTRPWGLGGGIHAANGPAIGEDTTLDSWLVVLLKNEDTASHGLLIALLKALQTDHLDWSLSAHRRGTLGGMDAAKELHGCTCGVSCDGGRARALQPSCSSRALKSGITPRNGLNQFPIPDSRFPPCTQRIPWQIELRHD